MGLKRLKSKIVLYDIIQYYQEEVKKLMRHGRERKRIDVDRKSVIHKSNNSGILLFNRRARTSKCFSNERIGRWRKRVDSLRSSECELKFDFSCLPRTRAASYIMLASGQRKKGQNRTEVAALHRMRAFGRLDLFTAKRERQSFAFRYNALPSSS